MDRKRFKDLKEVDKIIIELEKLEYAHCKIFHMSRLNTERQNKLEPIRSENGVFFYMTMCITPTHQYLYLGVLPEFKR